MDTNLAILTLGALIATIFISMVKPKINVGAIAIAFSFIIGVFFANLSDNNIAALFPSSLFLTLVGVTLFFGIAEANGLLDQLTYRCVKGVGNNTALLPVLFFFFTFFFAAIGPGNIAATAMLAPIGMGLAYKCGANPLLMAIMICTGANAGAFSPIAPTGVILGDLSQKINMHDKGMLLQIFLTTALIQSLSAGMAYIIFGRKQAHMPTAGHTISIDLTVSRLSFFQIMTLLAIIIVLISVIVFKLPIGIITFAAAVFLLLINSDFGEAVVQKIPWDAILLVTGVTVLIGVMEKAGGLELATTLITKISTPGTINSVLAFVTGVISAYSSSSGVVMPAFIPLIPGIMDRLHGGSITDLMTSVSVGSHMVDVSPLSTLGALCIANAKENRHLLFKNLLLWGLSMAVFGAVLSYIFLDLL